jgi:hypothetical protein
MSSSLADFADAYTDFGPASVSRFAATLDPSWVEEALAATGKASIRRRKLPADRALWVVLGMCLFVDRSIDEVVRSLDLQMPGTKPVAPSALPQARYRLGPEPLAWLFDKVANTWASPANRRRYKGLALYGMDGTHLRVPDSDANFEHFGKPASRDGDSGYPQLRLVAVMDLSTRLLTAARFGPYNEVSELGLGRELLAEVPDDSLMLLDRGFLDSKTLAAHVAGGCNRHVLLRLKSNSRVDIIETLPDGSVIGEIGRSSGTPVRGRVITYQHDGGVPSRIFTTLVDVVAHPADELVALYHERWELEVAFDELKTHMLQRRECLRSKKPDGVTQETWALLLTYNLLRREMYVVAIENEVSPKRISFWTSLLRVRDFVLFAAMTSAPGNIPARLADLDADMARLLLPPRRSERRYPRHVKIKMSNYKRNRGRRSPKAIGKAKDSLK